MNVSVFGQVFTPDFVVEKILSLRKTFGRCMEPSCGDGAISSRIKGVFAIEYDQRVCPVYAVNMDFFDYDISNEYESILGNPPYVKYRSICESTKSKLSHLLINNSGNLYMFFIEKCIRHLTDGGELIFIVPRDFLKSTACVRLNEFIYESGTITDIVDYGDMNLFGEFSPNCIIFRFEKGNYDRKTKYEDAVKNRITERDFVFSEGQLLFLQEKYEVRFSDLFYVKVGGVSGADGVYENNEYGNMDFVCSSTCRTGMTRRMIYNELNDHIRKYEDVLRKRKIIKITDKNWWMWGRDFYKSDEKRIYVNAKTRNTRPFFINECLNYDGSILAVFPKNQDLNVNELCELLNEVNWEDLGFVCDGRYLFSQRSLENTLLPEKFRKYVL